ncbi:hypothetical protein BVG16_16800 [Paenibacillus selenitireducens]|uniref:YgiT-type zinc finger domain-containing protein n=1 Tax=Paenibacillus selenitireducens TaxID=1324314 RepID=A0A1T2XAV0_9BACL|nr:hypothetical protein [Paenibacillus selenitireducens]OPA76816.1 hypothetical protein BVG16_16800 [Paenibacillus selenitireducens]
MSFCCGASMMGTKGTLKHFQTQIHNVPLLFCPVCYRVEVHHMVENEYEILAEYAHGDGADEVDFRDYVYEEEKDMYENCVNSEHEDPMEVVKTQIDMALDLLTVAKQLDDTAWQMQLKKRLAVMSHRKQRLLQKNKS